MKREIRNPIWRNKYKESVICQIAIIDDDGNEVEHNGKISKFSSDEQINPDWTALLEKYSAEDIDKFTEEFDKEQQEILEKRKRVEEEERTRRKEREAQEDLYERKLQLFELPEIKESKNRTVKSKIRKAKSELEAVVHAARLIVQDENKKSADSSE